MNLKVFSPIVVIMIKFACKCCIGDDTLVIMGLHVRTCTRTFGHILGMLYITPKTLFGGHFLQFSRWKKMNQVTL